MRWRGGLRSQNIEYRPTANRLFASLELQADRFAGAWARRAARLRTSSTGRVVPASVTSRTPDKRRRWFRAGFEHCGPDGCATFAAGRP